MEVIVLWIKTTCHIVCKYNSLSSIFFTHIELIFRYIYLCFVRIFFKRFLYFRCNRIWNGTFCDQLSGEVDDSNKNTLVIAGSVLAAFASVCLLVVATLIVLRYVSILFTTISLNCKNLKRKRLPFRYSGIDNNNNKTY